MVLICRIRIDQMVENFKTLFVVKSSLIFLYLALTIPMPFVSNEELKTPSVFAFTVGLLLIINITNDQVITCDNGIAYKTSLISQILGKKGWKISWEEIASIKSLPTSQGSKVHYFSTNNGENFLIPQRIENFERFLLIISEKTNLQIKGISYLSPLWTYKLLTFFSVVMIIGEIVSFKNQILSILNL